MSTTVGDDIVVDMDVLHLAPRIRRAVECDKPDACLPSVVKEVIIDFYIMKIIALAPLCSSSPGPPGEKYSPSLA